MTHIRTFILILASISYIIVIGAAVYEHAAIVPVWTRAIPASLSMFQGEYGITPAAFWRAIHPVTLLLFVVALIMNWRSRRRLPILVTFIGYIVVLAITFIYFVPELLALTASTPYSPTINEALTARGKNWEFLSLVRLSWLIVGAVILLFGLSIGHEPAARSS